MRILVTGSRTYDKAYIVGAILGAVVGQLPEKESVTIIDGGAHGLDSIAGDWGKAYEGIYHERFPARWGASCGADCKPGHRRKNGAGKEYCPAAGNYRNQEMVDSGVDLCLAFKDDYGRGKSRGTEDACARAKAAGIPTYIVMMA